MNIHPIDKAMIDEIIGLLPSADLKAKIKETNHQFKESELLEIIYTYAPTFDARLDLLGRFAQIASPDISALAKAYIEHEQNNFARFVEAPENVVYELHIKTTPDAWEENYLCASYNAALVCIDRFYEEYADINVKETEQTRYKVLKRKIFSESDRFNDDAPAECVLGPNKTVLEVSDFQNYFENFCEKRGICPPDSDDVMYPCFAKDLALVKYTESDGEEHFGVCLCCESCKKSCGLIDYLYVLPLDGATIRDHRFKDDFYDHDHIALPKVTLASPDDLDEIMRKNYLDFVAYWGSQSQSSDEKKIAKCDECGSEYLASKSKMASLCPECAHVLYGYENCDHVFKDGKCTLCLWDGSRSDYIKSLKQDKEDN